MRLMEDTVSYTRQKLAKVHLLRAFFGGLAMSR